MFETYPKLCKIVCSKYPFIFVDEYQDTSPLVIEILLESLQKVVEPSIVGFFGDSMQSIYDEGIGDIENYIKTGRVTKIEKKQNRRNPQKVIELANKLRTDGLMQQASDDANAPNMENGVIKKGSVKFLYGNDLKMAYSSEFMKDWNFENSKQTKELRLTHTLIAGEAHFEELYNIYDSDPVLKLKKDLKAYVKKKQIEIEEDKTFDEVLNEIEWFYQKGKNTGKSHLEVFLDDPSNEKLYSHVKDLPYSVVSKFYWEKDQLIDDKVEQDGKIIRDAKRDALIAHLFRIQDIIALYISSNYRDLLRKIGRKIQKNSDKRELHGELENLRLISKKSIGEVIEFANEKNLCVKSDAFNSFIEKNEYLYWRVSKVPYSIFQNLYSYIEGRRPFSTQHKVKGLPKQPIDDYMLPCLTSSFQNQGLNYYAPKIGATVLSNVISLPSNSDVYRAYYQPNEFTVLSDSYAIRWKYSEAELTPNQYLFMVMCINKVTDLPIYSYKNKLGGWNVVKDKEIKVPVKDGKINFELMEHLISAMKKLAIKDVVLYTDNKVSATKSVVQHTTND